MNQIEKSIGIRFGIILAIYYLIVNIAVFFIDFTQFVKPILGISNIIVVILLGITCIYFTKQKLGGYITLKQGFMAMFIMLIIGLLVNNLTQYVLFNFVNPEAKEINNEILKTLNNQMIADLKIPNDAQHEMLAKASAQADTIFDLKTFIFSYAQGLLGGAIAGILIALVFKNKSTI